MPLRNPWKTALGGGDRLRDAHGYRTRAVGVCLRGVGDKMEVLLVSAGAANDGWSLPGGGVEKKEFHMQAAARELLEEAGVTARVIAFAGISTDDVKRNHSSIFLMEVKEEHDNWEEGLLGRRREWHSVANATVLLKPKHKKDLMIALAISRMKTFLPQFGWKVTTLLLCCYGFLKEFRPSEPYLYEYEHCTLNISEHTLNSSVYPIWTYSYMIMLIPTFILTDLLLYKPVLIFEALSYIIVWCLFVFGKSILVQQMIEVFYGWATATEIAYTSYIYVKVERRQFKKVTSITQAALQGGRFSAYALSQLIILLKWGDYQTLNWISLISLFISLPFALILPMISWKQAYKKKLEARGLEKTEGEITNATYKAFVKMHFTNMYADFKEIYSNFFVVKWSLWWALASCVFYQVLNYTQTLWGTVIDVKNQNVYNGLTEAAVPLLCIPVVLLMHKLNVDWPRWGELCLTICSLAQGVLLMVMAVTNNLFVMYVGYILYRIVYQGMITIAQFNIAEQLASYSYGLVFGFNTFVALVLQSILTLIVVDNVGLALSIKPQFIVYSSYHFVVSTVFCVPVVVALFKRILRYLKRDNSDEISVQLHT